MSKNEQVIQAISFIEYNFELINEYVISINKTIEHNNNNDVGSKNKTYAGVAIAKERVNDLNHLIISSAIIVLYHHFEQTSVEFYNFLEELNCSYKTSEKNTTLKGSIKSIYSEIFKKLNKTLGETNLELRDFENNFSKLIELNLLCNLLKHGDGRSKKEFQEIRPDLFINGDNHITYINNHNNLNLNKSDLLDYAKSIKDFWLDLQKTLSLDVDK